MRRRKKSKTARKLSSSAPAAIHVKQVSRSGKGEKWLQESMVAAMKAVEDGMTVYRAS